MKYVPVGRRGVALGIAHDRYLPGPTMEKLAAANRRTTLFAQIETREGVDNADAIAAVDGVDCLWVGHFDLSCSLGIPGQFDHKDFTDAIATVAKACRKHDKSLGRLVPTVDDARRAARPGLRFHLLFRRRLGVVWCGPCRPDRDPATRPPSRRARRGQGQAGKKKRKK